ELESARESSVSTDNHQCVDAVFNKIFVRFLSTFLGHKFLRARRFQNSSSFIDDVVHAPRPHFLEVAFDHSLVSAVNPDTTHAVISASTNHRTDGCIHSGR